MKNLRCITCCFSGYRIEKMPFSAEDESKISELRSQIEQAVISAFAEGYTRFLSGMSTGFDLWAADAVINIQKRLAIDLLCVIPFEQQANRFPLPWKQLYNRALMASKQVLTLAPRYYAGCYTARNQYMINASSRLICYFDGQAGGTAQTIRMAKKRRLEIENLADKQLHF